MDLFWPLWRYILEFGAVLAVAGILRMVGTWISRRAQNRARNWPYVYGTVEHAEAKMIGDGRTAHWIGELAFSYSVDGAYYLGFLSSASLGGGSGMEFGPRLERSQGNRALLAEKSISICTNRRRARPARSAPCGNQSALIALRFYLT